VKGYEIFINSLFYYTNFGEELKFKVHNGSPLGYPFGEKTERKDHEQKQRNGKKKLKNSQ